MGILKLKCLSRSDLQPFFRSLACGSKEAAANSGPASAVVLSAFHGNSSYLNSLYKIGPDDQAQICQCPDPQLSPICSSCAASEPDGSLVPEDNRERHRGFGGANPMRTRMRRCCAPDSIAFVSRLMMSRRIRDSVAIKCASELNSRISWIFLNPSVAVNISTTSSTNSLTVKGAASQRRLPSVSSYSLTNEGDDDRKCASKVGMTRHYRRASLTAAHSLKCFFDRLLESKCNQTSL